jgi:hypothetical protein
MRIRVVLAVAAVLIVAVATVALAIADLGGTGGSPAAAASPAPHAVTLAYAGQRRAALAVVSGAASVTVTAAAEPGRFLRAWTPANSSIRPELAVTGGTVLVSVASTGLSGPAAVTIQLSTDVRWQLRFSGGASQTVIEMGNGAVSGVDFTAGSSLIAMTLPRPAGTVTLTLAGGASQVSIGLPAGVPARLQLWGGASAATLAGKTRVGIGGGTVLTAASWSTAVNRYDVAAPAGVSEISVTG